MALFDIQDPATQQTIRIEADREPTQEEAAEFLTSENLPRGTTKQPGLLGPAQKLSPEDAKFVAEQTVIRDELLARGIDPISRLTSEGILEPLTERGATASAPLATPRSFVEGLGRGVSLNLTDALGKLVLGADFKAENQPRQQSPQAFTLGETIGMTINPLNRVKAVAAPLTLGKQALAGARAFAPIGALAGSANIVSEKGFDTDVGEFLTQTLLGGGIGAALGVAAPVAGKLLSETAKGVKSLVTGNAVKDATLALEKVGIIKAPEAIAVDLLNPSGEGAVRNVATKIVEGNVTKPFQIVKETAGQFKDLPEFIANGEKTLVSLGKEIDPIIKNNPSVIVPMKDAAKAMVDEVKSNPLIVERSPEVVQAVENNAAALNKDFSLREAYDRLIAINQGRKNYFLATQKGQTTKLQDAEFAADEIQRKYLSGKLNDITEGLTGLERNPFREYGQVGEAVENVGKRFYDALVARAKETSQGGVVRNFIKNFDISKPLASLNLPVEFLRGGELGRLNRRVASLYDKLAEPDALIPLTVAQRAARLQGKIATPPLTPQAQAAANQAQAQQTLNQQIQAAQQANAQVNQVAFAPSPGQIKQTQVLQQPLFDAETQALSDQVQLEAANELAAANAARVGQRREVAGVTQDVASEVERALNAQSAQKQLQSAFATEQAQALSQEAQQQVASELAASQAARQAQAAEVGALQRDIQTAVGAALKAESQLSSQALKQAETGEILSDYYHFINTNQRPESIARIESELIRRMGQKKYAGDQALIRDALNIPAPRTQGNLPSKRELNLSEAISESIPP